MAKGMGYLRRKLIKKRERVLMRYRYYEMKDNHNPRNLMVPAKMQAKFHFTLGWCTKAVDSMADILQFRGFRDDSFDMNGIYQMNNSDILFDSAILGALISSCDFIYISADDSGFPRLQVIDGGNATGIIDPITGMLTEGYAVLQRDTDTGYPILEAYFMPGRTWFYQKGQQPYSVGNDAPYPLLVPIINQSDAKRPFGHSRITRACMNVQNNAKDALVNMAICSEVNSFPQKWILGMSEDAEKIPSEASISNILQINRDSDGNVPSVGQFSQAQLTPYLNEIETYAGIFAGECDLTTADLGFHIENTSDGDNYANSHSKLKRKAAACQKDIGRGFLNAGYLAACVRDQYPYTRDQIYLTKPIWEPVFAPDASGIAALGDAALKVNQAVPGYFGDQNMRDLIGIDGDGSNE